MHTEQVLLIIFIFIFLSILLYNLVNSFRSTVNSPNNNTGFCTAREVLDRYIRNIPSSSLCPEYENNLIVLDNYKLYEKDLVNAENCCYFGDANQNKVISNPPVCNGNLIFNTSDLDTPQFTVQELNQKPYRYRNGSITYINPSCDNNPNCLEISYDPGTGRYRPSGIYNRDEDVRDTTGLFWDRISFAISNDCTRLNGVYLDNLAVTTVQGNGDVVLINPNIFNDTEPLISSRTRRLFNFGGQYYPIARNMIN